MVKRLCLFGLYSLACMSASAKCGGVDYSWGADALALIEAGASRVGTSAGISIMESAPAK